MSAKETQIPPSREYPLEEKDESQPWDNIITPQRHLFDLPFNDLIHYRDLLWLFVRRDFVAFYKQTILGPLWFVIQPILTTLMMTLVFGNIAGLSTDGLPKILFYLTGVTLWTYFADCLTKTATTFVDNVQLFGKVYYPRLITPISIIISNLLKFGIQLAIFLVTWGFYWSKGDVSPQATALLLPILIVCIAMISLGFGLIFSAMTTKYRDLRFLLQFGVQLLMYATPVIYPTSSIPEKYRLLIEINPISPLIETLRHGFLGAGTFEWYSLLYSLSFSVVALFIGILVFNKIESNFLDTV